MTATATADPFADLDPTGTAGTDQDDQRNGHHDPNAERGARDATPRVPWPQLPPQALHGLAGDIVRAIAPHTEADPAALLCSLLLGFGNAVGGGPHAQAEQRKHPLNLFALTVGATAKGRKGTAWGRIEPLLYNVDEAWTTEHVLSGLSSGEGLISAVRDGSDRRDKEGNLVDEGITDKRVLAVEEEFSSTLKVMAREGNILSAILRQAWDGRPLRVLTRTNPLRATGAHISIIGHCTVPELRRYLNETEAANGFGNRFLYVCVKRSQELPDGGGRPQVDGLERRLHAALCFGRNLSMPLERDAEARACWHRVYAALSREDRPGMFGAVTSRAEAQALRLGALYAVLDSSVTVRREHLLAALAFWEYCEASARYIFDEQAGDPLADRVLAALRSALPAGLTRTDISNLLGRNVGAGRLGASLRALEDGGLIQATITRDQSGHATTTYVAGAGAGTGRA